MADSHHQAVAAAGQKPVPRLTQHFAEARKTCSQVKFSAEQRQQLADLEQRIRNYQGDDPLSAWLSYIDWIDKNCPDREDPSGALYNVIRNACRKFYGEGKETKYFDDSRYVGLWMKLTTFTNPISSLQFMYEHGIGTMFSELYISWAEQLETTDDLLEAKTVLERGIEACKIHPANAAAVEAYYKTFVSKHKTFFPELQPTEQGQLRISRDNQSEVSPCYSLGSQGSQHRNSNERKDSISDTTRASRTTFINDGLEGQPSGRSLADSAYGASFAVDRLVVEPSAASSKGKKPRDSLCIKRYEGLHVTRHASPITPAPAGNSPNHDESSKETSRSDDEPPPHSDSGEWSNVVYADPSRNKLALDTVPTDNGLAPPDGHRFMWNHVSFPSGTDERSFEENLAELYKRRSEITTKGLSERCHTAEQACREMSEKCDKMEEKVRSFENQKRLLEDHCRKTDNQLHTTEYQLRLAIERLRTADEMLHRSEQIIALFQKLFQNLTACLVATTKDVSCDEVNLNDAVSNLSKNMQHKFEAVAIDNLTTEQSDALEILRSVIVHLGHASEDRKVRHSQALPQAKLQTVVEKHEVGWESEFTESELASKENIVRTSISSSSSVNHQRNSAEQSNPYIIAMWNQTLNSTSAREPGHMQTDMIVQETVSSVTVVARSVSEVDGMLTVLPIRQSLAPRKSAKTLQTSAFQDPENMPLGRSVTQPKADFSIFRDTSTDPGLIPRVEGKEYDDKPPDDDSENTPPLETAQGPGATPPRNVTGVLNDSVEHPGVPPDKLTEKDFIEVTDSDSDKEMELVPEKPPDFSPEPQTLSTNSRPMSRKSIVTGFVADAHSEFETSFSGRKSIGYTDQTLPYIPQSEQEFFRSIDHQKRMASTPLVTTVTDEREKQRLQPRLSYLAPRKS